MFSVLEVTGARVRSVPMIEAPVIVATSLDGMNPFNSPENRRALRDG